jgi:16S rRNA (cytidine1402-2'-O)-methyltransferase
MVLLVQGASEEADGAGEAEGRRILRLLLEELPLSQASALAARISGGKKKPLYQYGLSLGEKKG